MNAAVDADALRCAHCKRLQHEHAQVETPAGPEYFCPNAQGEAERLAFIRSLQEGDQVANQSPPAAVAPHEDILDDEDGPIDESPVETERAPISFHPSQSLESFGRMMAGAEPQHRANVFLEAAKEALRIATGPEDRQGIIDELYAMGSQHGLSDDAMQNILQALIDPLEPAPAPFLITPLDWPDEAPPPIDWLAEGRIPRGDVTTLHGDGGAGKTDIACLLAEACTRAAPYWLGHEVAPGPFIIISAEEPERELRRRIWLHGRRDSFNPRELTSLHLWFPDDVAGAVFATPDRNGIMHPTPLFQAIETAIAEIAPVGVMVDNVAATFTGNQNDRVMVRSYVNLWRRIARQPSRPAVLLLDHPSLSGLTNGSGRGGNMDWRNAVRSALYLRVPEDKTEAELGIRVLETQKSNYGPIGQAVRLQWSTGGLQLEQAPNSLHRLAKDAECEEIFLRLLDERSAQGRHVSDKNGKNYAPAVFAEMTGASGFTAKAFAQAMNRLFEARRIELRDVRRDGKSRAIIDRADANAPPTLRAEAAE